MQSKDKCGEVFLTILGEFSWLCITCNRDFTKASEFVQHVYKEHFEKNSNVYPDIKEEKEQHSIENVNPLNVECSEKQEETDDLALITIGTNVVFKEQTVSTLTEKSKKQSSSKPDRVIKRRRLNLRSLKSKKHLEDTHSDEDNLKDTKSNDETEESHSDKDTESNMDCAESADIDDNDLADDDDKVKNKTFDCKICNKKYKMKRSLDLHKKKHESLKCPHCKKYFDHKRKYEDHDQLVCEKKIKLGIKPTDTQFQDYFKCRYCEKPYPKFKNCKAHEIQHHEKEREKCHLCTKTFTTTSSLRKHLFLHTGERPHICEYCPSTFSNFGSYKRHVLLHTGQKTLFCSFGCGKSFFKNQERMSHERVHTGEKPYVCELCGSHYAHRNNLNLHMLRCHTDRENWTHRCNECKKTFVTSKELKEHTVVHTGEKPHKCDECGRNFSKRKGLREHKKLHLGIKNHSCKICYKKFAQTAGLYGHMTRVHGVIRGHQETV